MAKKLQLGYKDIETSLKVFKDHQVPPRKWAMRY